MDKNSNKTKIVVAMDSLKGSLTSLEAHVQTRTIPVTGPVGTEVSAGYTIYE